MPLEEVVETIRRERHSRYPVCGSGLDDVQGVVHVKDVLALENAGGTNLAAILETPVYVSRNLPALQLLNRFRETRVHMAVVVDEYGGADGIVTPIDILSAIAGRLPESGHDTASSAVQREDGSWLMDGDMNLDEAGAVLGLDALPAQGYTTLAGLALLKLGHIPQTGATFEAGGRMFEVVALDGRRIDKLIASRRMRGAGV
jgi:putative hemolysin